MSEMDHKIPLLFSIFGLCTPSLYELRRFHFIDLKLNWTDAQHYCRVKYSDLATIESQADISELNRPGLPRAWIGLNDDLMSWQTVTSKDRNSWRWSSSGETSTTGYQNWGSGQPDNSDGKQSCVMLTKDGMWNDQKCDVKLYFVCYTAMNPSGAKIFKKISSVMSWKSAQTYCRTHHTDLAMIESAQENTAILSEKGQDTSYVWIGLYREAWKWSDNRESSFRNWYVGEPNNYDHQYCVMSGVNQYWYDRRCEVKLSFWCQEVPKQMNILKIKIETDADLEDPVLNTQLLKQLGAVLSEKMGLTNFKWASQPRKKEREKHKEENNQCPAK